ncbi:hypothetical protein D9619_006625 [Psilocybe cf. subviscida]|uniref:Uncharacterized protein n=1 Tax=Psilocybe cf. subviscida TaxID=2480587 RepID=A0A8H5B5J9_9AGAR|nr:hypothetical protein D9619_006625 [Psilocybe cf. subviscida]
MKFSLTALAFTMGLVAQVLANPTPQVDDTITYHCGAESGEVCPPNYRCCGPINFGTCRLGLVGPCPR